MIRIDINANDTAAQLERVAVELGGRKTMAASGKALEVELRRHFRQRNREPNRRGWPKANFWEREGAKNTALAEVTETSARIVVASPAIGHKLEGGTVRPKRGKALAIPLTAKAYAAGSPGEGAIPDLFMAKKRGGKAFLAVTEGKALRIQYVLLPKVTHRKDPRTLPDPVALGNAAVAAAEKALARVKRNTGGAE